MRVERVFWRLNEACDGPEVVTDWQRRMEALLLSDPRELLSFVTDAMIAVAAQAKDPGTAWEDALRIVDEATDLPERETVIEVARKRLEQIIAVATENNDFTTGQVIDGFHRLSRKAPWPE